MNHQVALALALWFVVWVLTTLLLYYLDIVDMIHRWGERRKKMIDSDTMVAEYALVNKDSRHVEVHYRHPRSIQSIWMTTYNGCAIVKYRDRFYIIDGELDNPDYYQELHLTPYMTMNAAIMAALILMGDGKESLSGLLKDWS